MWQSSIFDPQSSILDPQFPGCRFGVERFDLDQQRRIVRAGVRKIGGSLGRGKLNGGLKYMFHLAPALSLHDGLPH